MENLKKAMIIRGGNVIGAVGDKNFSTAPIGTVLAYAGNEAPRGYLLADGASYPTADYPDLYAVIGNTYGGDAENFNVPDYRETVLVGVGENTTDTIASHDVYGLGEFKDDQLQEHVHGLFNHNSGGNANKYTVNSSDNGFYNNASTGGTTSGRSGTTTHGKQKGVTYIIKAFHTNEGVDSGVSDDVINYVEGEIASKIPFEFGIDENGNYGYKKVGADTVIPFKVVEYGRVSVSIKPNSWIYTDITFNTHFEKTPIVIAMLDNVASNGCSCCITSISTNGFTVAYNNFYDSATASDEIIWIATEEN